VTEVSVTVVKPVIEVVGPSEAVINFVAEQGPQGPQGDQGDPGEGVPSGGSAGQVLVKDSATDYDASWEFRQLNLLVDPVPDLWFSQIVTGGRDDTNAARALNRMEYVPTVVSKSISVDRIAVNVSVAEAGATPRLGIYGRSATNRPGSLILDCGTVDASTTGTKIITINTTIPAGLFFLAVAYQGASSSLRLSNCALDGGIIKAHGSVLAAVIFPNSYSQAGVSGALPATYGGTDSSDDRRFPIISLRTATVL
jgi:hypothetical protein